MLTDLFDTLVFLFDGFLVYENTRSTSRPPLIEGLRDIHARPISISTMDSSFIAHVYTLFLDNTYHVGVLLLRVLHGSQHYIRPASEDACAFTSL